MRRKEGFFDEEKSHMYCAMSDSRAAAGDGNIQGVWLNKASEVTLNAQTAWF